MSRSGQIALGRIVLATRERILALEPRRKGILAYSLRRDAEVRQSDDIFDTISDAKPDASMIAIAEKIIEQQEGPFDPSQFKDRYEDALKALIEDKRQGHKPVAAEPAGDTNVIDLMAALRASLGGQTKEASKKAETPVIKQNLPRGKGRAKAARSLERDVDGLTLLCGQTP